MWTLKKRESFLLLIEIRGIGGVLPRILKRGIGWSCVVRFTLRPLYSPKEKPPLPTE
jgi:hypothetical protein